MFSNGLWLLIASAVGVLNPRAGFFALAAMIAYTIYPTLIK